MPPSRAYVWDVCAVFATAVDIWRAAETRTAFLTSLAYLPIVLGVMVVDRGPVTPESWIRGGRPPLAAESEEPRMMAPESNVDPSAASDP